MFANAEVQVLAFRSVRLEVSGARIRQGSFVRRTQIGGATQEPRNVLRQHVQRFARGVATGDTFRVGGKCWKVKIPSRWKLAPLYQFNLTCEARILCAIRFDQALPLAPRFRAAFADSGGEVVVHAIGNEKLRVFGPAVAP